MRGGSVAAATVIASDILASSDGIDRIFWVMNPAKMAAAGRGEYQPVADNRTPEGKAANRRTRIVILPQLDQFFKLLETK